MRLWKVEPRIMSGRNRVGVDEDGLRGDPGGIGLRGMKKGVLGAGIFGGEGIIKGS